jgi:AcrR family transcriptional regulator
VLKLVFFQKTDLFVSHLAPETLCCCAIADCEETFKVTKSKPIPVLPGSVTSKRAYKQQRASETASRIIKAANLLLNNNQPVSNEAIAEAANVSVSSIYRYFENRGDLFAAMFRNEAEMTLEKMADCISTMHQSNYKEVLTAITGIAAKSVSGDTYARRSTHRNISYDVVLEVNVNFHSTLSEKLTERIALIHDCHPNTVNPYLVDILARILVALPRVSLIETPDNLDQAVLLDAVAETAAGVFHSISSSLTRA